MGTITISMERFEELLRKEFAYDLKKQELELHYGLDGYVSETDRVLFEIGKKPEAPADDDF